MQRSPWRLAVCGLITLLFAIPAEGAEKAPLRRPNVLFIAVDDLNDWIGCLGGHPQAHTPNIDHLASRGVLFINAHCTAPICNASRASVMTGLMPSTSGVHGNQQDWRQSPHVKGKPLLGEYFRRHGYWTGACGKIFHANHGGECGALNGGHGGLRGLNHPESWTERHPNRDQQLSKPAVMPGQNMNGLDVWHWDWGPIDVPDAATTDGKSVAWAESVLRRKHDRPFFLAVGIYRPHGPWYAPQAYFDKHPLKGIKLPKIRQDDLDDVPPIAKRYVPHGFHRRILKHDLYESAVQAYLANVTFADAMVGRVLKALGESPYADNTIVCLWSDHGWHLGEKQRWHKSTNWEEATRVPLIVVRPGARGGQRCAEPVSLVDLYPTLVELCGLPRPEHLDGQSLAPQLRDVKTPRERPAITIQGGRHVSVRDRRWRYIRYSDGSEELYDHAADPDEFYNLAADSQHAEQKKRLARWIPKEIRQIPQRHEPPHEPGFRPLFNGYDLTGWSGDPKLWKVEKGLLVGQTTAEAPLNQNTFLVWTSGDVGHFELRLKLRIVGENNSGIQYRSRRVAGQGKHVMAGYQMDVHPRPEYLGMLYEERGRGIVATSGQRVVIDEQGARSRSSLSSEAPAVVSLEKWNDYAITARGPRLVHKVNGRTVAEIIDREAGKAAETGLLAIQLHRGKPMRVELKDIRLKELPPPRE